MTNATETQTTTIKNRLVEKLAKFQEQAMATSWDTNPEVYDLNESSAVTIYRELSGYLLPQEHRELTDAWSEYRHTKNSQFLVSACAKVVNRMQGVTVPTATPTTTNTKQNRRR